ncbi:uncharacterized protein LOC144577390 [Callithrix jacchus]
MDAGTRCPSRASPKPSCAPAQPLTFPSWRGGRGACGSQASVEAGRLRPARPASSSYRGRFPHREGPSRFRAGPNPCPPRGRRRRLQPGRAPSSRPLSIPVPVASALGRAPPGAQASRGTARPLDGGVRLVQGRGAEPAWDSASPRRPVSSPGTRPGGADLEGSRAGCVLPARAGAPGPAAGLHFGAQLGWRQWPVPQRGDRARTNVASKTGGPGWGDCPAPRAPPRLPSRGAPSPPGAAGPAWSPSPLHLRRGPWYLWLLRRPAMDSWGPGERRGGRMAGPGARQEAAPSLRSGAASALARPAPWVPLPEPCWVPAPGRRPLAFTQAGADRPWPAGQQVGSAPRPPRCGYYWLQSRFPHGTNEKTEVQRVVSSMSSSGEGTVSPART